MQEDAKSHSQYPKHWNPICSRSNKVCLLIWFKPAFPLLRTQQHFLVFVVFEQPAWQSKVQAALPSSDPHAQGACTSLLRYFVLYSKARVCNELFMELHVNHTNWEYLICGLISRIIFLKLNGSRPTATQYPWDSWPTMVSSALPGAPHLPWHHGQVT